MSVNVTLKRDESSHSLLLMWQDKKFKNKSFENDEVENAMQIDKYIQHDNNKFFQDIKISAPIINIHDISYHTTLASQRDTLSNILIMEAATTICIVMVSRRGYVTLMSGSNLSQSVGPSYQLPVIPGGQKVVSGTRSKGCSWVCDATVMQDAKAIVYALSDRSLHFYDTACSLRSDAVQEHRHLWKVVGLPHSVTSLCYYQDTSSNSLLLLGDEQGSIISLTFLQPSTVLFQRRGLEARPGHAESVYWPEILKNGGPHSQHVLVKVEKYVHCEAVLQIHYYPQHQTIISNSLDTKKSLVSWHKSGKLPTYTHSVDEGVRCFAFNARYQQLATGSDDGIIRLWNPLVTSKPTAFLSGHEAAVVDVIFITNEELLFTLCKFAELRLWHTKYQCCLQTIQLTQPQTQHWAAPRGLLLWQKNSEGDTLLVSLGPQLAEIPLDLDASRSNSASSQSASETGLIGESKHKEKTLTQDDWQHQQVQNLVEQAQNMEINVDDDETISKSISTSSKELESENHLHVPDMRLRLQKYPSIAFQKPMFAPSAIEIINFSDDDEDYNDTPHKTTAGMNERIEGQTRILSKRRYFVEQCAPHLALSLWPPAVISAPNNLAKSSAHFL